MILESPVSEQLPRGYVGPVTDEERECQMRIAALEQQQSQAWSEGVGKVTADVSARHADLRINLDSEAAKAMFRQVALSMCHNGGEFDRGTHPYFEQERSIAQALQTLRGEVNQIINRRIGPPEFEGMQQLADFDRPQTRTDLFKAWFGKSAVVDNAGRPLIVFHGTNRDLTQFDTRTVVEEGGGRRNQNWLGVLGSWFAAPSDSASYEIGNAEATADVFSERRGNAEGAVIYPVYLSIQKAYEFEDYEELVDECDESGGIAALRVKLVRAGYDGIVVRECSTDGGQYRSDWVAFFPTQIKSALSNVGTFDPNNPDIRWSVAPESADNEVIAAQADITVQEIPVVSAKKPSSIPPGKLPSSEMKSRVLDLTWGTKGIKRLDTPGMLAAVVNRTGRPVFVVDGNLGRNEFKAALVEAEQAGLEFDKIHVFADSATYSGRSIDFMRLDSVMPRGVMASTEGTASVVPQDAGAPIAVADSDAFNAWFRGSKVVDAQGSPLVVYHGTNEDITEFDPTKGQQVNGVFMTPDKSYANSFGNGRMGGGNVLPLYASIKNPSYISLSDWNFESLSAAMSDSKYDGAIVKNDDGSVYVVVAKEPTQIKSAIGNTGEFNPKNPDIRFSVVESELAGAIEDRPAFKEWFGGSKVVDKKGLPLVVYHGTNEDFTEFSAEFMGEGNGNSDWGDGFYFASNRDAASGYGDNVMPVYLDIKNPADAKVMLSQEVQDNMQDAMGGDATQDVLESMGYDGIIIDHGKDGKEYVVFKPSQIKSATLNNGRFDPTNPDIRFSVVESESDVPGDPAGPALLDVTEEWEAKGIETTLYEKNGIITLSKIVVPKAFRNQGIGSAAMRELLAYADKTNQQIALTPANDFGGNKARLNTFYRSFGFRTYKGFAVREKLIRDPEPAAPTKDGAMPSPSVLKARYQPPTHTDSRDSTPTETQAFKQWFGESKIVGAEGAPLVVYHGTNKSFSQFARGDEGIFFTDSPQMASNYAFNYEVDGANVVPSYLSIRNPLRMTWKEWLAGVTADGINHYLEGNSGLEKRGYDGVVLTEPDESDPFMSANTYVAFHPTQIKSAIGNNGAFNPKNPDIRFSVVEDTSAGRSVDDAALVSGGNAAIATLNRVMRSAGWEVEYIDMDLTAEKPKADIRVNRDDGRFLIAKVDSIGRASFETFQRERSLRMDGSTKGRRPLSPMVDDTFLGRQKFEGARSMLRGMTNYLADNATATIALSDLRSAWAGVMSAPIKQDAAPAVALSNAIASNAVAFHEDTRLSVVADAELVDASGMLVDDAGNPLTVYHGTTSEFTEFQTGEHGIFFTSSLRSAEAYAIGYDHQEINESGGRVHAAHLSLVNPAYIDVAYLEKIALANPDLISKESLEAGSNLSLQEAFEDSESWARNIVIDLVRRDGHDGMVIVNDLLPVEHLGGDWDYCTTYVVFSADQVRPIATPAREHRLQESETADVHHSINGEPNIQFSVVNDVGNPVEPLEPLAFHEDIPNEQWLASKVADVVEDGRNQWGVPRYMGPVTGRFSRSLNLPVSLLVTVPGERGEQDAIRQESLDYIHANWDRIIASQTPYIEVDPFGKAWVNEGNHRIMVAAERGLTHLPVDVRYFSGGQRQTADFSPPRLVQLDAQYTNSQLQQSCSEVAPEELEGEALARFERLPGLRNSAGASYTFWKLASAALGAVDGDAARVDWHAVEAATIQESVCANGQSHSSVCDALYRLSPGAVSEDRQKAILGLAQAVSEQHGSVARPATTQNLTK